jgi:hypothetical protein
MMRMSLSRRNFMSTALVFLAPAIRQTTQQPPRLARKDSFFGVHFDLHPNKDDTVLGRDVTDEMVERFLTAVKPDFVQYDCKGSPGLLGYPSRLGPSAPGIVRDSLEVWRRMTAKHGVALYVHFCGLLDRASSELHPEWARVKPDGTRDFKIVSVFSPHVDEVMIPQLKEVAEKYDVDGAWVDGESAFLQPDYAPAAAAAFLEATGIKELPKGPGEPGWAEFLEVNRRQFRRYVKRYVDEMHKFRPKFQITSNWLYTSIAPERFEPGVDYLSGDYLGNAALATARIEARYLAQSGKSWDLMAWGAHGGIHKPAVQLQQESAVTLAQGGGFQVYYYLPRAGRIDDRRIATLAEVSRFCRARQDLCFRSETVPQIGVVLSSHSLYRTGSRPYGDWGPLREPIRGILDALIENNYPVDVIPDWKLEEAASAYPLIVLPDWPETGSETTGFLKGYVREGGNLIVAGAENIALLAPALSVKLVGKASKQSAYVNGDKLLGNVAGIWQDFEPGDSAEVIELRYDTFNTAGDAKGAATLTQVGKGKILAVYGPLGAAFATRHEPSVRRFVRGLVERVFSPMAQVSGPPSVEVVLRRKAGKLLVHLINCTNMQIANDYAGVDFIPPVGPLRVSVKLPREPRAVALQPEGCALKTEWNDGLLTTTVDRLEIHSVLEIG